MKILNIAIDGPCGAGKSTIAKLVAEKLGIAYLDTGAIYRAIALYATSLGVDVSDKVAVESILYDAKIDMSYHDGSQKIFLNEQDVSEEIRKHEISKAASEISKHEAVRTYFVDMQRKTAMQQSVVVDGRDIGSFVLPNADVKIYLTAEPEVRAMRRYDELIAKGHDVNFSQVLSDVNERDYNDMNRDFAPLKQCEDAILIDSSALSIQEVAKKIIEVIKHV